MKNLKLCGLLLILLTIIPEVLPAQDKQFEVSGAVFSHYMWRGMRLSEGGVFQPSVTVGNNGFALNLWANYQFDPRRWSEADITASYTKEKDKYSYEIGYIHYGVNEGPDSDEIYTGMSHDDALKPSLYIYRDVNYGKGSYIQVGLEPAIPLGKKAALNIKAHAGYVLKNSYMGTNDEGKDFSNFYSADFQTSLTLPLGKRVTFEPMLGYSTALSENARQAIRNNSVTPRGQTLYGGATLTFNLD